jgi:serine/threonine protein phosphatase PrpC
MRLEILDAVSNGEPRPRRVNEDLFGSRATAVWVLDGATGIAEERVLPGSSDARWLVEVVTDALGDAIERNLALPELWRVVAEAVVSAFARDALRPGAPAMDMPCACLGMTRIFGTDLELANIGDSHIVHRGRDGRVSCFGSSNLPALDESVRAQATQLQSSHLRRDEIWPLLLPLLRRNRGLMNLPEGYWIVDVSARWLEHVETSTRTTEAGDTLLLATDGFWRLVDTYGRHDPASLLASALDAGLAPLVGELRAIEATDGECRRYPRLKARDDATAVLAKVAAGC